MYQEIRKLSKTEKEFVEELLGFEKDNDVEKFQMGKILFSKINTLGIRCCTSTKTVEIYKSDEANANKSYTTLMGLFCFLKELIEHGYIGIDTIVNKNGTIEDSSEEESFWIYNHKTHSVEQDTLLKNVNCAKAAYPEGVPIERFRSKEMFDAMRDLVYNKVLYVRPALKELKENGFQSIEESRHHQVLCSQWAAIGSAIVIPIFVSLYTNYKGTQIHSTELQQIEKKIEDLNQINIVNSDTLRVESISIGQQKSLQNISYKNN